MLRVGLIRVYFLNAIDVLCYKNLTQPDLDPLCSPAEQKPIGWMKGLTQPVISRGKLNQLSEHMIPGRGHSVIQLSIAGVGMLSWLEDPAPIKTAWECGPVTFETHWHPRDLVLVSFESQTPGYKGRLADSAQFPVGASKSCHPEH